MFCFVCTIHPNMDSLELYSIANLGPTPKAKGGGPFVACALKLRKHGLQFCLLFVLIPFILMKFLLVCYVSIVSWFIHKTNNWWSHFQLCIIHLKLVAIIEKVLEVNLWCLCFVISCPNQYREKKYLWKLLYEITLHCWCVMLLDSG